MTIELLMGLVSVLFGLLIGAISWGVNRIVNRFDEFERSVDDRFNAGQTRMNDLERRQAVIEALCKRECQR